MATFPAYAKVLLSGYSEKPDYGVLRTEMDGGIARQRARWTKPIITRSVQIMVKTRTDKTAFDTWMRVDLDGGAGWFDYREDGVTKKARIVDGAVSWSSPGVIWVAECQLETIG